MSLSTAWKERISIWKATALRRPWHFCTSFKISLGIEHGYRRYKTYVRDKVYVTHLIWYINMIYKAYSI